MAAVGWLSLSLAVVGLLTSCQSGQAARRRASRCHPFPPLQDPSESPPLVVTGRVLAFYPVHVPHLRLPVRRRGLVQVSRVLAGHVTRPQLVVEGFYQIGVCNSRLRLRAPRIFFLRVPEKTLDETQRSAGNDTVEADFQLISTARITARNIKTARSYSDFPLESRNFVKGSCDDSRCPYGGQCRAQPDGRVTCACPDHCPRGYEPVCGTDGQTYRNSCQLRVQACNSDTDIRVASAGKCKAPDPCRAVQCPFNGRCVPSGPTFSCRCPTDCPTFRGQPPPSMPVCGSDGVTYPSLCELNRQACVAQTNVTARFNGECDPCSTVTCPEYQVCQVDSGRHASCRCSNHCERRVAPVCASDGLSYESLCMMQVEACRSRRPLNVIYQGKCSSGVNPCSALRCGEYERCEIDRDGVARCTCPDSCQSVVRPVCASDGRTYDNTCRMELERCRSGRVMYALHYGVCGTRDPCATHRCPHGGLCRSDGPGDEPRCECPQCTDEYSPVCATDGTAYNNECKLRLEACEKRIDLRVQYTGLCKGCENKHCPHYGICESRPNGEAACTCPRTCVPHNDPVCGIDGITYANECEMKVAACNKQQFVTAAYKGDCDLCQHVVCKFGARCEAGRCVCPTDCPSSDDPVCGTDGTTYGNECLMQARACTADQQLATAYLGSCRDSSNVTVSPCYGLEPLLDPETSRPFTCSDGGVCPADSYCHRSPNAGVCCPLPPATVAPLDTTGAPGSLGAPGGVTGAASSCANTSHGCCEDGVTPAVGPEGAGCPSSCHCHRLGALGPQCDPVTNRCACRPGVGGRRCDRCKPGFWGLPKIARGNRGCQPCGCSAFGSARDDCEQSHGFCVCKPGVFGSKCNKCPPGETLLPDGCGKGELKTSAASCSDLDCYFGASCVQKTPSLAECSCNLTCPEPPEGPTGATHDREVCGTDGQTYRSACQLRLFACRGQKDITIDGFGRCAEKDTSLEPTGVPFRRSTLFQSAFTEQSVPSAAKSTRHLLPEYESNGYPGRHTTQNNFLVQGWLGSPCSGDGECRVLLSSCRAGVCQCQPGYEEAPNRQQCTAMTTPMLTTEGVTRLVLNPCMSRPCLHGGFCQQSETDHESFSCLCPADWGGETCHQPVGPPTVAPPPAGGDSYERPSFSGRSYLTLRAPKATIKLQLEVEFVSHAADGLLLYGQQAANGTGDFIALVLVDGFVEFRYDIGNGPVVIRSLQKITEGEYHKVVARRYHGDGQLIVDDGESVHGQSEGKRRSLDLRETLYVGYVPSKYDRVYENAGTVFGLVGCVRRLRLGGATSVDLRYPGSRDVTASRDVSQCRSDPCASQPCHNGGLCVLTTGHRYICQCSQHFTGDHCEEAVDPCSSAEACASGATCSSVGNGTLQCLCPPGRWGDRCQEVRTDHISDLFVPNFGGSSYLQLRALRDTGRSLELELRFLARSPDGVLLYSGQRGRSGDFIGLRLTGGRLHFGFNVGSGAASIKSKHPISLNKWHSVQLTRYDRDGSLQVDNGTIVRGSAPGHLNELNLDLPLYVGGVDSGVSVSPALGGSVLGLDGAVQAVGINGALITDLMAEASFSSKITRYIGAPCGGSPCKNGGRCLPQLSNYICQCTKSYTGRHCHKKLRRTRLDRFTARRQSDAVHFSGKAFVLLPNMIRRARKRQKSNRLSFQLRTAAPDGLIAWQGRHGSADGNFFSVGLANGTIQLTFNMARSRRGIVTLGSKYPVNDGLWHRVRVRRRRRWASVQVDRHGAERSATAARGRSRLHTDGKLYIGGSPSLSSGLPFHCYRPFTGCLRRLAVSRHSVNLATHVDNVKLHRCPAV